MTHSYFEWPKTPCNFSPLSDIFALVLCTAWDNLVWYKLLFVFMIKFSDKTILAQCTGHLCQQFWNHCPHVQEFWIGVMILIYKQSSELLIFCVLLLNRGPTFTFKITCGKKKKKKMKICPKVVLEFELSCFCILWHFNTFHVISGAVS